ncbi:MAG TPA: hypothetical protein VK742_11555 [Candidatus Sulfotelmatobacter sp.]|jgi:hypothetical protein|nr:hypothetical protein [Candidatus Sulfotelmatobacter sp.]
MNFCARRFNLYLILLLAVVICGCGTFQKKKPIKTSAIRVHVEAPVGVPGQTRTVRVLRSNPLIVTVDVNPILTEQNLLAAGLVETPGGYAVKLQFDETGGWMLEQATASNPGKHLVVFGQWGEKTTEGRFLAIPLITGRNSSGVLSFTPDCSREEAQRFVEGLNEVSKLMHQPEKK